MTDVALLKIEAPLLKARESNKNKKYSDLRDREYLLESEVTAMMKGAKYSPLCPASAAAL